MAKAIGLLLIMAMISLWLTHSEWYKLYIPLAFVLALIKDIRDSKDS